jgi:hypothetical protein
MAALGMAAVFVSGCTPEPSESEPAAQSQGAVTTFTKPFSFHKHYAGKSTFVVSAHGTVTVAAHATWDRPAACKLPTFDVELVRSGLSGSEGARAYPTTGATSTRLWANLEGGTYHLVFDSTNDDAGCELVGAVTVTITP